MRTYVFAPEKQLQGAIEGLRLPQIAGAMPPKRVSRVGA